MLVVDREHLDVETLSCAPIIIALVDAVRPTDPG